MRNPKPASARTLSEKWSLRRCLAFFSLSQKIPPSKNVENSTLMLGLSGLAKFLWILISEELATNASAPRSPLPTKPRRLPSPGR